MKRRIIDIVPPKEKDIISEKKTILQEKISKRNLEEKENVTHGFKFNISKSLFGKILFFILIVGFVSSLLFSFSFSKVEVYIFPNTEELSLVETIIGDTRALDINIQKRIIPGKFFEIEEEFSQTFPSTGKILKRAEGTIRVFNSYTTKDEVWKEGTRFVSADGKIFKSKDKILVPGAKVKNGKLEPSFVDVPVIAFEGGAEYNIGPSEFSIIAFKGTPRYFKYYGKSFSPMQGGGEFSVVSKEDLEKAEKELIKLAESKAEDILSQNIGEDFIIPKNGFEIYILEKNSSAKEDEEKERFEFKIKVNIKAIVLYKEFFYNFVNDYLNTKIKEDQNVYFDSITFDLKNEVKNFELGKGSFRMSLSVKTYPKLEMLSLKKAIAGRTIEEAKFLLLNEKDISKVKIEIFPFWIKKVPNDINRIKLVYPVID